MTWNKCRIFSENHELLILYDIYNYVLIYMYIHIIFFLIYIHIIYIIYVYDVYMYIQYDYYVFCQVSGSLAKILMVFDAIPRHRMVDFPQPFPERGLEGGQ